MIGEKHKVSFLAETDCDDEFDAIVISEEWQCPLCSHENTTDTIYGDNPELRTSSHGHILAGSKMSCSSCNAKFELSTSENGYQSFLTHIQ